MTFKYLAAACFAAVIAVPSSKASAQDVAGEYLKRLKVAQTINPHGPTPFGEQLNPYTGDLTFTQTDLTLEGTGPTIRLTRNLASRITSDDLRSPYSMGDWVLSIPRIETLTHAPPMDTWQVAYPGNQWFVATVDPNDKYKRCTYFNRPQYKGTLDDPNRGWNGMELITDDGNRQSVLKRDTSFNLAQPNIAEASSFPAVTQQHWQIGCLPQTSNGEVGEAFIAVSPDGTKIWLDHLAGAPAFKIIETDPAGSGQTLRQGRMMGILYATRVQDRFGNWIQYHYANGELDYIDASDGRYVDISWAHDNGVAVISDIVAQPSSTSPRTWHYSYSYSTDPFTHEVYAWLTDVQLPDQTHWAFSLNVMSQEIPASQTSLCVNTNGTERAARYEDNDPLRQVPARSTFQTYTSTITHPSGLVGSFTLGATWHGRSYVPTGCIGGFSQTKSEELPPLFGTYALISKQLSGPGLTPQVWTYNYSSAIGSSILDPCATTLTCIDTSWVDVIDPSGNRIRHTYSTSWGYNEGKELRVEYYDSGSQLLRTEIKHYANVDRGPWPTHLGSTMMEGANSGKQEALTPLDWMEVLQQGRTFRSEVVTFDAFGRPVQTTRRSTTP